MTESPGAIKNPGARPQGTGICAGILPAQPIPYGEKPIACRATQYTSFRAAELWRHDRAVDGTVLAAPLTRVGYTGATSIDRILT